MKQTATFTIRKHSKGYTATIKPGKSRTIAYDFHTYNNARSFIRRNFEQVGTPN